MSSRTVYLAAGLLAAAVCVLGLVQGIVILEGSPHDPVKGDQVSAAASIILGAIQAATAIVLAAVAWTSLLAARAAVDAANRQAQASSDEAAAAREAVAEMQLDREERREAFVVAYAEVTGGHIVITVENRGPGPATDVQVTALDDVAWLRPNEGRSANGLPIAIGYMPGALKVPRSFGMRALGTTAEQFPPARVRTTWLDHRNRERSSESIVDPGPWLVFGPNPGSLAEIREAIDHLTNEWSRIERRLIK